MIGRQWLLSFTKYPQRFCLSDTPYAVEDNRASSFSFVLAFQEFDFRFHFASCLTLLF